MLREIHEYRKYLGIAGFKNIHIRGIEWFLDSVNKRKPSQVEVQFFNAELIATWQHLYFAALNALTSFQNEQNISNSIAMETMLYSSAQHQIKVATRTIGIKPSTHMIAALIIGDTEASVMKTLHTVSEILNSEPDSSVLEITKQKEDAIKRMLKISRTELRTAGKADETEQALTNIVIERMALLATRC